MKKAAVIAAGLALAASVSIGTPSFGATSACDQLQHKLDRAELRLARRGLDTKAGSRAFGDILTIKETARVLHCHLH